MELVERHNLYARTIPTAKRFENLCRFAPKIFLQLSGLNSCLPAGRRRRFAITYVALCK